MSITTFTVTNIEIEYLDRLSVHGFYSKKNIEFVQHLMSD